MFLHHINVLTKLVLTITYSNKQRDTSQFLSSCVCVYVCVVSESAWVLDVGICRFLDYYSTFFSFRVPETESYPFAMFCFELAIHI